MDKNTDKLSGTDPAKTTEESQAGNLNWLLDIDLSEPEERLFTVDQVGASRYRAHGLRAGSGAAAYDTWCNRCR